MLHTTLKFKYLSYVVVFCIVFCSMVLYFYVGQTLKTRSPVCMVPVPLIDYFTWECRIRNNLPFIYCISWHLISPISNICFSIPIILWPQCQCVSPLQLALALALVEVEVEFSLILILMDNNNNVLVCGRVSCSDNYHYVSMCHCLYSKSTGCNDCRSTSTFSVSVSVSVLFCNCNCNCNLIFSPPSPRPLGLD